MRKRSKKKIVLISIISLILLLVSIIVFILVFKKDDNKTGDEKTNEVKKVDEMVNYDYYLEEDASEYYKELYNELKEILNNEEVDGIEYAKIVSKLFVTDVFTLDNKITSSDIGGLQFIYASFKDDFIKIAKTSLYSSVESNIYGDREQKLPIVTNVEVIDVESSTFSYNNEQHNSYVVSVNITYQEDLGYPSSYKLTLINNDKYLQVVSAE